MEYNIQELKITLDSNLDNDKNRYIDFTINNLKHTALKSIDKMNKLPLITMDFEYSEKDLLNMSYLDRVKFFFDRAFLNEYLNKNKDVLKQIKITPEIERDIDEYLEKNKEDEIDKNIEPVETDNYPEDFIKNHNSIVEKNVLIMLRTIFHTTPSDNVSTSFDYVTNKMKLEKPDLFNIFNNSEKMQFLHQNKKYSIEKLIWLNDILNHPVYNKLFAEYIIFNKWLKTQTNSIYNNLNYLIKKNSKNLNTKIEIKRLKKSLEVMKLLKEGTFSEISVTYYKNGMKVPNKYSDLFKYVDSIFTKKESTNEDLQNFLKLKTKEDYKKFFKFFDNVYDYYIEDKGEMLSPHDQNIMNTGVAVIQDNRNSVYQINVLCDLLESDTVVKTFDKTDCKSKDLELGKRITDLTTNKTSYEKNKSKWSVDTNRIVISIERANSKNDMVGKLGESKTDNNIVFISLLTSIKDFDATLNKVNSFLLEPIIEKENVLNYLLRSKDRQANRLYEMINQSYKSDKFSSDVYDILTDLKIKFSSLKNLNYEKMKGNPKKETEFENSKYDMYLAIIDKLIYVENKKAKMKGGNKRSEGKRSQKNKKRVNYTRKIR